MKEISAFALTTAACPSCKEHIAVAIPQGVLAICPGCGEVLALMERQVAHALLGGQQEGEDYQIRKIITLRGEDLRNFRCRLLHHTLMSAGAPGWALAVLEEEIEKFVTEE